MRILFLTQVFPYPPDAGPKVRSYYLLRYLVEQGHEVTLVAFVRKDDGAEHIAHLQSLCHSVQVVPMHRSRAGDAYFLARSVLTGQSFLIARDTDPAMRRLVDRLLDEGEFDAIHADQLWMAQYAVKARGVHRVLDQHNAVYLIPQRLAHNERNPLKRLLLEREWRMLAHYEADICRRFDRVVTVTDEDRLLLTDLCRHDGAPTERAVPRPFHVIPICVDPDEKPLVSCRADVSRILLLGTMFWPPNVEGALWFAREVFPEVLKERPHVRLTIIGKNPPQAIRSLANSMPSHVEVTGYVDDVTPYLEESAVFAVPLHAGGGMRVKILDAWCWGIPIVSTTIGAEGIDVRDGENILMADDAPAFARAVIHVLEDPALAQQMRVDGRQWVEDRYNWRRVYPQWDEVYESERA